MPDVSEKDIELNLNDDLLTIRAEKRQESQGERGGMHVSERSYGTFQRSLRLPFSVEPDQVQARFENGVLTITLPKSQPEQRSRRIPVQGGQDAGSASQPSHQSAGNLGSTAASSGSVGGGSSGAMGATGQGQGSAGRQPMSEGGLGSTSPAHTGSGAAATSQSGLG